MGHLSDVVLVRVLDGPAQARDFEDEDEAEDERSQSGPRGQAALARGVEGGVRCTP